MTVEEGIGQFLEELENEVRAILIAKGLKKNDDLVRTIEIKQQGSVIQLIANDYYTYVSTGRRKGVKKVPIKPLIQWMNKRGIRPSRGQTKNQVAFAIQNSIFKNGIKGKNYIRQIDETIADRVEEYVASLSEEIILKEIDKFSA